MTRPSPSVTYSNEHSARLPDWAVQGITLVLDLERRGQLEPLNERARIRREGGYAGFDVVLFFIYYFASQLLKGVRTYWEDDARSFGVQLAAVGGWRKLASPASLSRALSAVEFEHTRTLGPWLLRVASGIEAVMRHPAAMTWDALGQPWHTSTPRCIRSVSAACRLEMTSRGRSDVAWRWRPGTRAENAETASCTVRLFNMAAPARGWTCKQHLEMETLVQSWVTPPMSSQRPSTRWVPHDYHS